MDILTFILLLIVVVLIISNNNNLNRKLTDFEFRLMELQNLLNKSKVQPSEKPTESAPAKTVFPAQHTVTPPVHIKPPPEVKLPVPPLSEEKPLPSIIEHFDEVIGDVRPTNARQAEPSKPAKQIAGEPELSFFERYPDLEKFIGEKLVNKIGIAILVLAIGFFVKYAIDNNWIGAVGRVGIGVICGGILVGLAHRMRTGYPAFSSVLVGGGLAIFYFTITLAFQQFNLFSQTVAFVILIVITVFAVILALLYNRQELAVIALIGGFASPFMVSNGTANYNGLFIYLLILNTGLLIIAYYKAWRILNISSFVLSVAVLATVLFTLTTSSYYIGFRYATIFYLLFFTINIINNIRESKKFLAIDFTILLINTALYFAAGLYLLTAMNQSEYRGLFSAGLACINLVLSFILFKRKSVDTNVLYLLIGITLTFISLTAPIQLHGNNITLFWASESVLLYWLHLKSGIKLMKLTSLVIWIAMTMSLLIDIVTIYGNPIQHLTIVANKGFITGLTTAIASYLLFLLVKKDPDPQIYHIPIPKNFYRIIAAILLFLSGLLEVGHQFSYYYPHTDLNLIYTMLYTSAFAYLFYEASARLSGDNFKWPVGFGLLACCVIIYLALTPRFFDVLRDMLEIKNASTRHFMAHWANALIIILIVYRVIRLCRQYLDEGLMKACAWVLSALVVLFFSLELGLASNFLFYSPLNNVDLIQTVYVKTGLPVIWGISSFILMWIGMRNKLRALRIISLTLFLITLIKLFLFDINNIPVAGKIAAFFCLGVLLLIISFMYQKVKKIIADDEEKPKE